ncbi:MAG: hypothetical protein LIO71_03805 [Ruminococcus sp.]|nr:hypothetical protein [Ruminococcus sp.]
MKYTQYYPPMGKIIKNIDINTMYNYVVRDFKEYWSQEKNSAQIHYFKDENLISSLIININLEHGIYLNYSDFKGEEKLSVYNKCKLDKTIFTTDLCEVSLGLFLPPILAWEGIKEFLKTGTTSNKIQWITPEEIPQNRNY